MILLPRLLEGEEYLLITFKPANQSTQKVLFICVVCTVIAGFAHNEFRTYRFAQNENGFAQNNKGFAHK
mgnify:CR=1 FL=1